jgi:hypothetical protein
MRREHVDRAHAFFEKYGRRSVVLARFVPIVRTFLPVTAGIGRMTYRSFIVFNAVGALVWGVGVTLLGYWLGRYEWIGTNIDLVFIVIVLVSFIPIAVEVLKKRKRNKSITTADRDVYMAPPGRRPLPHAPYPHEEETMTQHPHEKETMAQPADPNTASNADAPGHIPLDQLDLSPQGLADAPASQEDTDSIVYIGIPD